MEKGERVLAFGIANLTATNANSIRQQMGRLKVDPLFTHLPSSFW
jgi:hypothetical protein